MSKQTEKKLPGWAVVLLVVFYPAGLIYLLCKALNKNKDSFTKKGNILLVIAALLIFTGTAYPFLARAEYAGLYSPEQTVSYIIVMLIACFGGGAALLVVGLRFIKLGKLYQKYVPGIENSGEEAIDKIASMAGTGYETAMADLQTLINKGALKDRYIDHKSQKLVWTAKPKVKEIPKLKRFCSNCGAVCEVIPGQPANCEYCDSPIQVN